MSKLVQTKAYIKYFNQSLTSYDVHSPFLFDFITHVLNDNRYFNAFGEIEAVRKHLLKNTSVIEIEDLGAGSKKLHATKRKISDIAKTSLTNEKFGKLLFRIVNHYSPHHILELGTSLGISALYLAKAKSTSTVTTLEGSKAISHIAHQVFEQTHTENIQLITGNFSDTLPQLLSESYHPDLVYIDGNHRMKPTLDYFNTCLESANENCILILDDIHWSSEMEQAWNEIKHHPQSRLTVDLFYKGIVFTQKELLTKQNVSIRF
ncbi:MAG: class I SAM-dependent methyltransferase [Chitinophagales bacterium]|nr:class I SAM-dependent methyltransferase [Chitinophagales bacterium]MBP8753856.1 class I SAM-dependent methyltransferase [Chitinophagales bacterium]MBP9188608.1 class I SAM-dependent methyltransferase [Chitinophagales bacterium]MBP9548649.1 class I SAM-dependent methyltransferase [Chitinophagales bacterium]MBP9704796.1 class I SAM-dependent methyltransferase [Chitinophagales bacterium]